MPISGPGSRAVGATGHCRLAGRLRVTGPRPLGARGFTLLELLVVLAIVAVSAGLATLALRDSTTTRLERDAVRLAALLEMARAESRASGTPVRWLPGAAPDATRAAPGSGSDAERPVGFRFLGLMGSTQLPSYWLDQRVVASVPPPGFLQLGPEAILPAQRLTLRLDEQSIEVASDGLGPFVVGAAPAGTAP